MRQDARIKDLYCNNSEIKLSIISLYIISDAPKYDIIWTENSEVIDSFISEILKYKSWILATWCKRSWTVRVTPSSDVQSSGFRIPTRTEHSIQIANYSFNEGAKVLGSLDQSSKNSLL